VLFRSTCYDSQTANTALDNELNNIVNSGAMVMGSLFALALSAIGVPLAEQLLLSAAMCLVSAWLGRRLYQAETDAEAAAEAAL